MAEDIFINKPISNPKLTEALRNLKKDKSSENMLEVLKASSEAVLVVPVTVSDDGNFSFNAVTDSKKRRFIVVFADTESFEIDKSYDSQKAVTSSFEDLMEVVLTDTFYLDGIVINPQSDDVLFGKELLSMISNQIEEKASNDVEIKVGAPDHYPDNLYKMTSEFLVDEPKVQKVYVRLFHKMSDDVTSWMFILDVDGTDSERAYICETFNRFIAPYCDGLNSVTIDINEEYAADAVKGVRPFCEKK